MYVYVRVYTYTHVSMCIHTLVTEEDISKA